MTSQGIQNIINRLLGTYPLQYKGFDKDALMRIYEQMRYNFEQFDDDEVNDALTGFINADEKGMPPSAGQIKSYINRRQTVARAEQNWDKTRLVEDDQGRLYYNQAFEYVRSDRDPSQMAVRWLPDRPLDGKKGFKRVRVPLNHDELQQVARKHGWKYERNEDKDGKVSYDCDIQQITDWIDNDRFRVAGGY